MHENTERTLTRDCPAIQIPAGNTIVLEAGVTVFITQSLGGSYTVATEMGLARISAQNADALGLEVAAAPAAAAATAGSTANVDDKQVWDQLKTCYDPEIPVNIVDLGLVYSMDVAPLPESAGFKVNVAMTLTAPGCGMGPAIAEDARSKIVLVPGVSTADVRITWDPPWNQSMISEEGKMKLGLI